MSDEDVNEIIENLRGRMAELTEVTEDRLPQDGDTVDVDYSGTDEEGNKIDDVQGENFGVALGQGQARNSIDIEWTSQPSMLGHTVE